MSRSFSRRPTTRSRLPWWIRRGVRAWARCAGWAGLRTWRRSGCKALGPEELAADDAADERRCGWFDSSQDLREGLCISEHANGDAVSAQLPVAAWVQLQLSSWRLSLEAGQPEPAR